MKKFFLIELTCCMAIRFALAYINTRACNLSAFSIYTEKSRALYLQRGEASIGHTPRCVSAFPDVLLVAGPAERVSL